MGSQTGGGNFTYPAPAPIPWRYSMQASGVSLARYMGDVDIDGNLNVDGSISIASINTSVGGFLNVKAPPYNAVGDGVANDTAAVQAAFDAAFTLSMSVYFPPGIYSCTSLQWGPMTAARTGQIAGAGSNLSRIVKRAPDNATPVLTLNATGQTVLLSGLKVTGLSIEGAINAPAVRVYAPVYCQFNSCRILGQDKATALFPAMEVYGGISSSWFDCEIRQGTKAVSVTRDLTLGMPYPNDHSFLLCEIKDAKNQAAFFDYGVKCSFVSCDLEGSGTAATADNGGAVAGANIGAADGVEAVGLVISDCWFESMNGDAAIIQKGALSVSYIHDCYIAANPATNDIKIDAGRYEAKNLRGPTVKAVSLNEGAGAGTPNLVENVSLGGAISVTGTKTAIRLCGDVHQQFPGNIYFQGKTSAFPMLQRSGSTAWIRARLGDNSGPTNLQGLLTTAVAAVTGLTPGALAGTTNASIVLYDATGQAYRVPCII